ncbi:MAG: hypothetical protein P1U61_03480 [Legionellaceae bacterium]|nr:hypothetical protein [Legionellaceae bacterium]
MEAKGYLLSSRKLDSLDSRLIQVKTIDQLPEEGCLLVIFDFDGDTAGDDLRRLRQNPVYRYTAFYAWDNVPDGYEPLFEGAFDEQAYDEAKQINDRIDVCEQNDGAHTERQDINVFICRYLFSRKKIQLLPQITCHNPYGFIYPLVQALSTGGSANEHWYVLNSLVKREYLEVVEAINELQVCPKCEGGLLNFKNCCPNCESVDLHVEPFVHCFSCGNIGPVKEFMSHQELVCSRCQTTLKHIGIDYDKPLEDKICEKCQHRFFEPNTLCVCLVCDDVGKPEGLKTRKLNAFQLTQKGREFAKNQLQKLALDLGAFFELINFNLWELIVQWQIRVSQRHSEVEFVAGVIFVENINELIEEIGFLKTEQQLVLFYENARSLFRKTDLISVEDDKLYCLLTMTNLSHIQVIQERIEHFDKNASPNDPILKIKFGFLASTEILENELDKDLLINEMLNRVNI